jgi:hypothetical protein
VDALARLGALALACVLAVSACGGGGEPVVEPSALPGSTAYPRDLDLRIKSEWAMADMREQMLEHYDARWDASRYELVKSVPWDTVAAHYAQALGEDWVVDTRFKEDAGSFRPYHLRVWTDGDQAVAIGLSELPADSNVLTVMWPLDE